MKMMAVKRVSLPHWLVLSVLVFFFTILFSMPVHARGYNLDKVSGLYKACQNVIWKEDGEVYDKLGYGLCFGYVRGVKNTYDIQRLTAGKNFKGKICYPNTATWLEIIKVFNAWVDNNPKALHKATWLGMVSAMKDAYPCGLMENRR